MQVEGLAALTLPATRGLASFGIRVCTMLDSETIRLDGTLRMQPR